MKTVIEAILKAWEIAKTSLELKEIAEGPAAQALALSKRADRLMAEYKNNVSSARLDAMKKEISPLYINLATQMTGLAQKEQLAINQAYGNQKAVLEAIEEVRRQMPSDTVDQMGMLALDTVHAMDETFLAIVRKLRYELIAKWARKRTEDSANHIHVMDQIFGK